MAESVPDKDQSLDELVKAVNLDPGAALVAAVVEAFFRPTMTGYSMQSVPNGMGGMTMQPVPEWGTSPLEQASRKIFEAYREPITAAIIEKIDVDDLSERIAKKLWDDLTRDESRYGYNRLTPQAEDVRARVRDKLTDRLSARAMADWDREQSEMRAAWQRERERADQPQLESGPTDQDQS